jgi:hypothetical protein
MYSTWTFPSSNGAERNGFDNNGYTTWTTCNFFPSYLFFPRSAPLCATMIGTALEHLFLPRSAEQSGTVMTMMGQCSGAISIPVARSRTGKDEMYKRPVFCGVIRHCSTERNGERCTGERMPVFWGVIRHCSTERNGAGKRWNAQGT